MGKVVVKVKLTNYVEEQLKKLKLLKGKPRSVETEVLVDTGAARPKRAAPTPPRPIFPPLCPAGRSEGHIRNRRRRRNSLDSVGRALV